jgi:hypothetical protein
LTRSLRRRGIWTVDRTTFGGQAGRDPRVGASINVYRIEPLLAQESRRLVTSPTEVADDVEAFVNRNFVDPGGDLRQGNQPGTDGANFVELLGLADID